MAGAIISAGTWVCSSLGLVGATAAGVTVAAPVVATATTAAVAYKYGVTPSLVLSGATTVVSTGVGMVSKVTKMTARGIRNMVVSNPEDWVDDDEDDD